MNGASTFTELKKPSVVVAIGALALIALPICIWLDLKNLSDQNLTRLAGNSGAIISNVRSYYAKNVVGRVLSTEDKTVPLHNYQDVEGAIPIPATLSIELGDAIKAADAGVIYRFVSDFPFKNRSAHNLSVFEKEALSIFRNKETSDRFLLRSQGGLLDRKVTQISPVVMAPSCVGCHNSHPESNKKDWKIGDVRGLQGITVSQPISWDILSFKWLLGYFAVVGSLGLMFSVYQFRLAGNFSKMNTELEKSNEFLADVSLKISKYLSPQVYRQIFLGEKDVSISTERKMLTVFFSDISDFTATTDMLEPEELTALLNEYFSEMSTIAVEYGATIDKFLGDGMVAFFGDPETQGVKEDAEACVRMAMAMQSRLLKMEEKSLEKGLKKPFKVRMGIHTGYCNVGNFGSDDRMDYTIIGREVNLAARLESIADPGGIVLSTETYRLVQDIVAVEQMDEVLLKGFSTTNKPYRMTL